MGFLEALPGVVAAEARAGDLVVLLGAGDITQWAYALPRDLSARGVTVDSMDTPHGDQVDRTAETKAIRKTSVGIVSVISTFRVGWQRS